MGTGNTTCLSYLGKPFPRRLRSMSLPGDSGVDSRVRTWGKDREDFMSGRGLGCTPVSTDKVVSSPGPLVVKPVLSGFIQGAKTLWSGRHGVVRVL